MDTSLDDDDESKLNTAVEAIVNRARQLNPNAAASGCPLAVWTMFAWIGARVFLDMGMTIDEKIIDGLASTTLESVLREIQRHTRKKQSRLVPAICSESASIVERNSSLKRKYEHTILQSEDSFGGFVSVKSYTQFCLQMSTEYEFHKRTNQILQENIGTLFPREKNMTSASEKPRSAQLARLIQAELASFDQYGVECVHQYPVAPAGKTNEQYVDIACVVHTDNGSKVAATIEYKPTMDFPDFRTQAAVYATDTMNHTRRPCLVVQMRGTAMHQLYIRVYGIVIRRSNTEPSHAMSLLLDADGEAGLGLFFSGLQAYFREFLTETEGTWHQGYLSKDVSAHDILSEDAVVYKSYDYRTRERITAQDRRAPNLELVKECVDQDATVFNICDNFQILRTKFLRRNDDESWYGPILPKMLAKIASQLDALHKKGIVHGDIRIRNMILHAGVLIDFDLSRKQGSRYPSTLQDIHGDGERHPDVKAAIAQQAKFDQKEEIGSTVRIEELEMKMEHDVHSMMFAVHQFGPVDQTNETAWIAELAQVDATSLPSAIEFLNRIQDEIKLKVNLGNSKTP
ncbi:MAG: hypothetical protein SGBAC_012239 [Bacillariaceae sp.]